MGFIVTAIPGLFVFEPRVFEDERGFFFESFSEKWLEEAGINTRFVQDNQSFSHSNVVRGLHYQLPPYAQAKLVRVLTGRVLDVAVDIRKGSPSFGKVFSIELSDKNKKQLFIPAGFAHGFSVLDGPAQLLYKCDAFYNRESEGGIAFNDPQLAIDWKVSADRMIVSEKDVALPYFANCKNEFIFEG
jgi:dTDP-4-dehydrorhamnose 3,5-epimerase